MKRFFGFSALELESSKRARSPSAPNPESSKQALGPSVVAPVVNARVDIIFLHGLTGHREKTWTATGEDEPWPKSLLPKDLLTARIITYGYDADVVNLTRVAGHNTVREHATNLINDLAALRRDAVGRPIIFVAHSLGGLVCQDALLVCNNPNEEAQRDILSSTCGIAFLGTPHAGSDLQTFATAVANIVSLVKTPNNKLLQVLGRNSEILANIKNDFLTMVQRRLGDRQGSLKPIALHAFIEERPVDFIGRRIVEPNSAKIPGYNSDTIPGNHMEMTKFKSASDLGYTRVLDRLKVWIGDDGTVLLNQFSIAFKYANDLRLKFETLWPDVELAKSEPPVSAKQLCESSNVEPSLKWFMDSVEYRAWQNNSANLWLHGEHGEGKTVIMSYVLRSLYSYQNYTDKEEIVSIFCSCNDSEDGVVASIAIQLLQNRYRAKSPSSKFPIPMFQPGYGHLDFNRHLWTVLTALITANPKTILIIDGIDKLNYPVRSSFLNGFCKLQEELETTEIRVLISSVKNDGIQNALSHYSTIDREKERRECLKTLEFQEWNAREIGVQEVEGAGKRFFCHPEYCSWIQSYGPSVLWLEGKPGSGKSTLVKFMVNELEKDPSLGQARLRNPSHKSPQKGKEEWIFNNPTDKSTIFARFYYSFRGGNTQTNNELMLRSIVYQIWSENSRLFPLIRDRYRLLKREASEANKQKSFWSYDDLKWALDSLCKVDFNLHAFIIVDGMDESNNDKRADILKFLLDLAPPNPKSSCVVKVFIASRPENNINSRLRLVPHHIKLQEVNGEDIRMVVEGWIKRMVSEDKCKEETLLEVKEYIIEHSHGVFLWVTLVLRDLEQYIDDGGYSKSTLDTRLRSFPKELGGKDGFYRAMVDSLVKKYEKNQEQQERGRRILAWVTFAERPISVTELRDALATPPKSERADLSTYVLERNRPEQLDKAILSTCGGLAEVRGSGSSRIVQPIHQTAREFLLHKDKLAGPYHLDEVQGDMEIAMACCRYLSIVFRPDFPQVEATVELPKVKMLAEHLSGKSLLVYALLNFQTHLDHLESNDEKIRDEFMNFVKLLIKRNNSYASLILGKWIDALKWPTQLHVDDTSARLCLRFLLLCAADTGKKELAEILLSLRADLVHLEAGKGHLAAMKQLVENSSRVTPRRIGERTPFTAVNKDKGGLKLLLDMGADANLKDTVGRTPLSYSAENGHRGSLDLLLAKGVDIDLIDSVGRTPVSYAAENGHRGIFELLIAKGVDIDSKDSASRTPVSYAAENGHEGILEVLLLKDADVNSIDSAGWTPLSYAARNGHEGSLNLLVNFGANINSKDSAGRTPLSYAAGNGHEGSLKLLLQHGPIDVNSKDTTGRTPLSYATANGHIAVVEVLQSHITT
ncbi:hypothetical protein V502_00151 [Pseudogymnoascus sp. VKM F-4520 (FW-2644)]|nr:hypothetical protein V502_00151 [Pseudogymnoascus sp. VKM F-4520 (FW-2644)]